LTFMLMFGYMFGDLGQGGVLFAAGLIAYLGRGASQIRKDIGTLLLCCGGSAMVFGILYGSVFGSEELLPRLWVSPSPMHTKDLGQLLMTAVCMGVVFLSISLIFNIINHFRAKKFFEGTFDKYGVLGLVFYWACLITALVTIATKRFNSWSLVFIIAPLVLLLIRIPLGNLIKHHSLSGEEGGLFAGLLEGVIDTMETLTGYLSGTVSFIRVGAYAISHAALCLAIYSIMGMLDGKPGATVAKVVIAIFGNILIIGFEGMVAAIQCVRLEYYEMFSRFFQGGGVEYKPFKINK
ncbi:MAG: V-type ATP synthase subunit I, partial [Lentisphaeria bacterium]|nr:V-type ATP synthase subunit I [Lentisphaeria bacterium]